jgi:hypothetical protein
MTALAEGAVKFIEVGGVGDGTMRARKGSLSFGR